ncbi:MAG: hypothetical protein LBR23_05070 [Spirochaetaceae bacterium]|jgi:hypothetical protein|nr:hypothetical protein [Spirochaetaceae bacterium]
MENLVTLIFNAENIRMIIILAVGLSEFIWLKSRMDVKFAEVDVKFAETNAKMDVKFAEMDAKIEKRFAEVDEKFAAVDVKFAETNAKIENLRNNDFLHLANGIKALTHVLKENKTITEDQKTYIDSHL